MDGATPPKTEYEKRAIWDIDTIRKALDECEDERLYVAINLAFACSLRVGEILGLQWERVHISDKDIANDNAYIEIDRELERVSLKALNTLDHKDVYHVFQPLKAESTTRRVLKAPKTKSSVRRVWLPVTVANILRKWGEQQEKCKIQGKYAGTVTDIHKGTVFVRLHIGVNAVAHSCYDNRMPGKKDDVSFVVTRIDADRNVAVGLISRIIKQNI